MIEENKGNVVGKYVRAQNLSEAAKEIQQLLDYLAQTYPTSTESEIQVAISKIEQKPELRERIINAFEKGGKTALEKLVDHPAAAIAIAIYDGWKNPEK
ncbi:MAG: hypothetical protein HC773_28470 [Scytonema sp. CRU_2_7]|nr:hypothetical protein [Scytonema sp. CRU_2_7]